MRMSESFKNIAAALSKFQGSVTAPLKNKTVSIEKKSGGKYTFTYSELPTILEHIKKPFSENGLSWSSGLSYPKGDYPLLITRLFHETGEWIETEYGLPNPEDTKQFAGEITYGRRYSLTMLLGISAEQDADEMPDRSKVPRTAQKQDKVDIKPLVSASPLKSSIQPVQWSFGEKEITQIQSILNNERCQWTGDNVRDYVKRIFGKDKVTQITQTEFGDLITNMGEHAPLVIPKITTEPTPEWERELNAAQ